MAVPVLKIKKLLDDAKLPTRATDNSAGLDFFSPVNATIPAFGKAYLDLGWSIEIPEGHYGRLAIKSGAAVKHDLEIHAGVIDADFRDGVRALIRNFGDSIFDVKKGDAIVQLVCEKISIPTVVEVETFAPTQRTEHPA